MLTHEIRSANWKELCENFSRTHRNSVITIEAVDREGFHKEIGKNVRLQEMKFEQDGCNDRIVFQAKSDAGKGVSHTVIDPIYVRIQESPGGSKILKLDAENEGTWVHFHSGEVKALVSSSNSGSQPD
jgi:hypothetical protein